MNILNNNFNKELVVIASRPNQGKTYTILSSIKESLKANKKVLFISLDNDKEAIKGMLNYKSNLIIYDKPLKNTSEIIDLVNKNYYDIVYIDYFDLLPAQEKIINLLRNISSDKDIPIIVAASLDTYFDNYDFENIKLNDVTNNVQNYLYQYADKFIILSNKKQYVLDTL